MNNIQYSKDHWNIAIMDIDLTLLLTRPTKRELRSGQKTHFVYRQRCVQSLV